MIYAVLLFPLLQEHLDGSAPAVAYDAVDEQGHAAFSGSYPYGNAFGCRLGDATHILTEPG